MAELQYSFFDKNSWTMEKSCGTAKDVSINPAPFGSGECIYIIHNSNTNETYIGYAKDVRNRWSERFESFHCLGIEATYAREILCAYCVPQITPSTSIFNFTGANSYEHFLMRAVVKGLLGKTTCTNTKLARKKIDTGIVNKITVWLPGNYTNSRWGKLEPRKTKYFASPQDY